ncbi:hypothetical protein C8A01DRAFT_44851 [Parachaetomium inaequale]|uniref:Fe2OG dioxygenase domain-containing protein n=1 Tax=Parachaetomium inaequale TaxID=2588326 RepID=A0AAN6PL67_9PEZI|nr:hypothetical protein C8A01DRAFT_44851 [Parachaetomium inaequale]
MPSPSDDIPPFPDNLPLAPIAIISHAKLLNGDQDEAARVLEAAKTDGFFDLNLQDTRQGEALLAESEQLRALAKDAFAAPLHEKLHYALERGVSLFGYKPAGTVKTTDRDQRPDTTEFFNISKDYLHNTPTPSRGTKPLTYPPQIENHRPLLQSFTRHGHACGMLILRTLASQLGLPPDEFTNLNLFDHPSGDHCRLTHKTPPPPPNPEAAAATTTGPAGNPPIGLPSHTDFGSVTILFNWLGGLQIESHGHQASREREWEWVKPLPSHAIVNLGDAMATFTNGVLKSAKHRVVPSPAATHRYSVVYFVRPHNDVPMKPLAQFANRDRDHAGAAAQQVAGKFSATLGPGQEVLAAGEWMRQRAVQLGN